MASPVYIVCAESGSEDIFTGLASLYNVIDGLVADETRPDESARFHQSMRIVAVWRADRGDDYKHEFEGETRLYFEPQGKMSEAILPQTFRFTEGRPRHRITAVLGAIDLRGSSALRVESRIRPRESDQWLSQSYWIDVIPGIKSHEPPCGDAGGIG
jgi:hypothetical protein